MYSAVKVLTQHCVLLYVFTVVNTPLVLSGDLYPVCDRKPSLVPTDRISLPA